MTLQTRLLLGYGYLVTLLVISAITAAIGFHDLADKLATDVERRIASRAAATALLAALERGDSATLTLLVEPAEPARRLLASSDEAFLAAEKRLWQTAEDDRERELAAALAASFPPYREARDSLLAATGERPLRRYEREVAGRFATVRERVFSLLEHHTESAAAADRALEAEATRQAALHGLLVALALVSLGYLSRQLRHHVLDRLRDLLAVATAVAEGDHRRRARAGRDDELGVVSRQLNAALDARQRIADATSGRLAERREQILALLAAGHRPAALIGPGGELLATTLDPAATEEVRVAASSLRSGEAPAEPPGLVFVPLVSPAGRALGWLAETR